MRKRVLSLLCCAAILLPLILSGCGNSADSKFPTEPAVPIVLKEQIPSAAVDVSYDLSALIKEEDGVKYAYAASYVDPQTGETKDLKVKSGKIIPKEEVEITVTVTATRGEESSDIQFTVPISITADIMDKLLSSDGLAGQADEGVSKVITKDSTYLHSENSTSSLSVTFAGGNPSQLLNLNHYSLQPYYSSQVWKNSAVSFWVYNPMEQDVSFKLTSFNPETKTELLWDSAENTQLQTAKAGTWTNVVFSLYDMGITQPLYDHPSYPREDSLKACAQYAGNDTCTVYIDEIDIVDANSIGLTTGYTLSPVPSCDYSDLLSTCRVYTEDSIAQLSQSANGNGTTTAYRFGSSQKTGYPTFYVDFPQVTDISGFDYMKFDVFAENSYPYLAVSVRYLDDDGNIKKSGIYYDYYANQWRTLYVNLDYLSGADLTRAVGFAFSVHMDTQFVAGQFNAVYFDNISLYEYPNNEPQMTPAVLEDNDIISGTFYTANTKTNINGVCKVSADEVGNKTSNSTLLFWTNNVCGYPCVDATFMFDTEQDWTNQNILSFDTHQAYGHYWLQFTLLYLDDNGRQQIAHWYHDTIDSSWKTNHASLDWFKTESGVQVKPADLSRVIGFRIAANMAINVTGEVALIYFDNFILS